MADDQRDAPPSNGAKSEQGAGVGAAGHDSRGRFTQGNKGGGRPNTKWIRDFFAELSQPGKPQRQVLVLQAMFTTAIDRKHKDHVRAGEAILAYVAGKPIQAVEVAGPDGGPLETIQGMTSEQQNQRIAALLAKRAGVVALVPPDADGDKRDG